MGEDLVEGMKDLFFEQRGGSRNKAEMTDSSQQLLQQNGNKPVILAFPLQKRPYK